eukprot:16090424-Heterocapsa_arctica.AAC.1
MGSEPQCLWATGVITKEWTAPEDSEHMKEQDLCQPCREHTKKVYIDGSATQIGASAYCGWGIWSLDNPNFEENGPLKGRDQGSDKVRSELWWLRWKRPPVVSKSSQTINTLVTLLNICLQEELCTKENTVISGKESRKRLTN